MPYDVLALGLVTGGLVCGAVVGVRTRAPLEGLRVLLDYLLAAGLIRLAGAESWAALLVAALTVVIRQTAVRGLRAGDRTSRSRPGAVSEG